MPYFLDKEYPPESLAAVPAYESVMYENAMGRLGLRLADASHAPYISADAIIYRDVELEGEQVGVFNLEYDYVKRRITTANIEVPQSRGVGRALYTAALELSLPSGGNPRSHGFTFESLSQSEKARSLWLRLVDDGIAEHGPETKHHYIMR